MWEVGTAPAERRVRRHRAATARNVVAGVYGRPLIRVEDFIAYVEEHTYTDNRVRPFG